VCCGWDTRAPSPTTLNPQPSTLNQFRAFTLIEILVVVVLLSLIILALMTVFNSTQTAFRASLTQSDVLEGGRSAMGMIKSDLEEMAPSFGASNGAVNFSTAVVATGTNNPLLQSLVGSGSPTTLHTNLLENIFILTRQNMTWTGVGYVVDTASPKYFNPLYRFSMSANVMAQNVPAVLFTNFFTNLPAYTGLPISPTNPSMSHLMDGVVDLRLRAYDPGGLWMTNIYDYNSTNSVLVITNKNVLFLPDPGPNPDSGFGEVGFIMYSNTLPASVEINLGVLEDRAIQRAQSLPNEPPAWAQSNYLAGRVGQVHVFRQRVWIRNVDPSAYQ
jgi:prepilin-type N-terminal cleavage/methylation domain-containing protein